MNPNSKPVAVGAISGAAAATVVTLLLSFSGLIPQRSVTERTVHDYLLANPKILVAMTDRLQSQQQAEDDARRQAAVNKLGIKAFIDPKVAFVTGPSTAKTTIVEFFDYNCPFCRASLPAVKQFYETHSDLRFAFIEYPIKGDESVFAARAAVAARRQPGKYIAFHFALMNQEGLVDQARVLEIASQVGLDVGRLRTDMNDPDVIRQIDAAETLGRAAQVDGTPTFIVNGQVRPGAIDTAMLKRMTRS